MGSSNMSRLVSAKEVAHHNSADDCWVVIDNRVWDVTAFATGHPGGADTILQYAGSDATEAYNEVHGPTTTKTLPATQLIGQLDLSSIDEAWGNRIRPQAQTQKTKPPLNTLLTLPRYRRIWMRPRLLRDVSVVNTPTKILGVNFDLPVVVAPVALARLAHPDGERGIAHACAQKNIGYCLYVNKDRTSSESILQRIWGLDVRTLFVTIDSPVPGKREADERVRAEQSISMPMTGTKSIQDGKGGGITRTTGSFIDDSLCWEDLAWLRMHWQGRLVLKGIQSVEDALTAVESRINGIVLSNHGGRNLDNSPPAILTLLELNRHCPHVLRETEVLVDGGIRRGTDILKAICLGARGVLIGRPVMYALSYDQEGVEHLIDRMFSSFPLTIDPSRMLTLC
ncbi:unnamed protein product [Penicillium olsonii]|nr:unnamed protein product [Penicillium olsonii]CAG7929463.1 unnamed protein product [Penicillium olsonii]